MHTVQTEPKKISADNSGDTLTPYDRLLCREIEAAIVEADAPNAEWVSNVEANASWAQRKVELNKLAFDSTS